MQTAANGCYQPIVSIGFVSRGAYKPIVSAPHLNHSKTQSHFKRDGIAFDRISDAAVGA